MARGGLSFPGRAAIAGVGQTEFSKRSGRSELRLAVEAVAAALADAGLEPADVDGLAEAIARLAGDDGLRTRMGRCGRERVLARFAWPGIVRRTIALYEELLAEPR